MLFLAREAAAGRLHPILDCRLAEALLHQGERDAAVECARRAFPAIGRDAPLLHICAWVFSNCGCHDEAAAAYAELIALAPDWSEGYRHASSALLAAGRTDEAIAYAVAAAESAPDEPEYALHAAALLIDRTRLEEASRLAARGAAAAPHDTRTQIDAAELLMRCDRIDEAVAILRNAAAGASNPAVWRALSTAEMLEGECEAALAAVDRALAGAPDNAEYHLHRGHLSWRLGDLAEAARAFERAAALDPAGRDVKRSQMSLYLAMGLTVEATATGGALLRQFPEDKPSVEAVLHLLNHRLDTIDGDYVVLGDGAEPRPRMPRRVPSWLDRVRAQRRVIRALIIRETRTRFADSRLGYGWALIEPAAHIALLSATFAVLMHGRPPIGEYFFLFYYTGLIPYHIFVHASAGMSQAIVGNAPLLQLPPVTTFDVIAARGLLEVMTDIVVAVLLLAGFLAIGIATPPDDFLGPVLALMVTAALGCGIGCVNAVVTVFWRSWEKSYAQAMRVLYFVSGIFYVPGMMPEWARDILAWNPLLHAIDWFRAGFFASYQPHWLDRSYLVVVAIVALLAGLALHRGLRRRLTAPL